MVEAQRRLEIQELDHTKTNQNFKHWNQALEAFALGWRKPKVFHPVIISPNSPVSTPQELQQLAGMTEAPRVINTTYTTLHGKLNNAHLQADRKAEEVQVGEVSWRGLTEIKSKAEYEDYLFVFVDGKVRHTVLVKSLKADNSMAGQEARGETQGDQPDMSSREV